MAPPSGHRSPVKFLSLLEILALGFILLAIFVLPGYSSQSESITSSGVVSVSPVTSTTLYANNPGNPIWFILIALTASLVICTLLAAWTPNSAVHYILLAALICLTGLTVLGLLSIGFILLPATALGWLIFALTPPPHPPAIPPPLP